MACDTDADDEWLKLLEKESFCRQKLHSLGIASAKEKGQAARDWWSIVSKVLDGCVKGSRGGNLEQRPPVELWRVLQGLAEDLAAGNLPEPMSDVAARGRGGIRWKERQHKDRATAYIQAAKRGVVDDKTPIKTVQDAFSVTRQTAQKWAKGEISDLDLHRHPQALEKRMREAGAAYSKAGRGTAAVRSRDKRQTK